MSRVEPLPRVHCCGDMDSLTSDIVSKWHLMMSHLPSQLPAHADTDLSLYLERKHWVPHQTHSGWDSTTHAEHQLCCVQSVQSVDALQRCRMLTVWRYEGRVGRWNECYTAIRNGQDKRINFVNRNIRCDEIWIHKIGGKSQTSSGRIRTIYNELSYR